MPLTEDEAVDYLLKQGAIKSRDEATFRQPEPTVESNGPPPISEIAKLLQRQQPPPRQDAAPSTSEALSAAGQLLKPFSDAMTGLRATFEDRTNLPDEELKVLGARPDVPFDVTTGAGPMGRIAIDLALNREQQRANLLSLPNVNNVTFNSMGEPILTVKDPQTGQVKDILANPIGIDPSDFAFVAANLPELLIGGLAAKGMNISKEGANIVSRAARTFLSDKGVLASAGRMALAGESAGLIKDLSQNVISDSSEPTANVAERRGVMAVSDFLFGAALGGIAKGASRALTPLQTRGPLQVNAENAQKLLLEKTGVLFDLTPGEATGNQFLLRSEAFMAQKPGSASAFNKFMAQRREAQATVQGIMLGVDRSAVPPADLVGQDVLNTLQGQIHPLETMVDSRTLSLLNTASDEIKANISGITKVPASVEVPAVGKQLFESAEKKLEQFRAASRVLYDRVNNNPLIAGQGRNIDATPLAQEAQGILDSVAAVEKTVEKPTGLLDEFGAPITKETQETQPFSTFVESSALSRLKQLASAEDGKVSLRDLIELRRDISDDLSRGSAIGGLPERRLGDIKDAITSRIKTGLDELDGSGTLRKDWETANKHYADNIKQFKDTDIVNIFKDDQQRGALGLNEVVNRALNDPDRWASYRSFFGGGSDEMNLLRRAYADKILGRVEGSEIVDGATFVSRLKIAYENQPTVFDDVFKSNYQQLRALGQTAEQAAKGDVDAAELGKALKSGTLTQQKLIDLQRAQNLKDNAFQNKILRDIAEGKAITNTPSEIVDKVVFKAEPEDVTGVVAHLSTNPDVLDEVRQRTLLRIIDDATAGPTGKETVTSLGLDKFLKDEQMTKRLTAVLGPETMELLQANRDALAPGSVKEEVFGSAGRLVSGNVMAQIEKHLGEPKTMAVQLARILKSFIVASAYKVGPIRNYITNADFGPGGQLLDKDAFIQGLMIATPVIEDMAKIFGDETSRLAAIQIKSALDGNVRQNQKAQPVPRFDNAEKP